MKAIAFNGSPRKHWNTATLLEKALEGAASLGAETELIHLYDYTFKGCAACYSCKRPGSRHYGECAQKDELTPILEKIKTADVLLLGAPIYLGAPSGVSRSFLERLAYPYLVYDREHPTLFPRVISTASIYTMGVNEEQVKTLGYDRTFDLAEMFLARVFGNSETLLVTDTSHVADYSTITAPSQNGAAKAKRRKEVFPQDCQRAYELGARLAAQAKARAI